MCLYGTRTDLLASWNQGLPSKEQKIVDMQATQDGREERYDLHENPPEEMYPTFGSQKEVILFWREFETSIFAESSSKTNKNPCSGLSHHTQQCQGNIAFDIGLTRSIIRTQ
jgi:hypothetical protein